MQGIAAVNGCNLHSWMFSLRTEVKYNTVEADYLGE